MGHGFQNISQKECRKAHFDILENADQKWASAKTLADLNDFGSAASMAIIAIEEQVKALLLIADANGFRFRQVKGMVALFENHQLRYMVAYYMFVMAVIGGDLIGFLHEMRDDKEKMKKLIADYQTDKEAVQGKALRYIFHKYLVLKKEIDWFAKVDFFRQQGFYSDFDGQLQTPLHIDKAGFEAAMKRFTRVYIATNYFIALLQHPDEFMIGELKKMKESFKKDDMYSRIAKGIENLKAFDRDPFAYLKFWIATMEDPYA